jgi:hypothetical protein
VKSEKVKTRCTMGDYSKDGRDTKRAVMLLMVINNTMIFIIICTSVTLMHKVKER